MARISTADVLAQVGATYRAIDLRIAARREQDHWENVLAAIRLTSESVAGVRQRHKELVQRHGSVGNEHFMISLAAQPFTHWEQLCAQVSNGALQLGDTPVQLAPLDLRSQVGYMRAAHHSGFFVDEHDWPSIEITVGQSQGANLHTDEVMNAVPGYQAVFQAIAAICEADTWPNLNHGFSILLQLPIFAAITGATVQPVQERLDITVRRHSRVKRTRIHVVRTPGPSRIPISRTTITKFRPDTNDPIRLETGTTRMTADKDDYLEVTLTHPMLGELDRYTYPVRDLLPAAARNLLFEVLKEFCTTQRLEELLTKPGAQSPGRPGQAVAFEHHVAWLLSLVGFSPVVLGQHETFKHDRSVSASIDIIATHDHTLLLVACTISAPKSEDFTMLWHLRTMLASKLADQTNVTILPVLVTGITATETYHSVDGGTGIPIIDVEQLRKIITELPNMTTREFVQSLAAPLPYQPPSISGEVH